MIISDEHQGIKKAASKSFIGSSWQLCTVRMKRNLMKTVPKKSLGELLEYLDDVFNARDIEDAMNIAYGMIATHEDNNVKDEFREDF